MTDMSFHCKSIKINHSFPKTTRLCTVLSLFTHIHHVDVSHGEHRHTVNAWQFLELICHCSFVLYHYQHGRNAANYCNYYYVTAMTVEMNTNFENNFIHPFCKKLLKISYRKPVTLKNKIDSLINKRCTFSLSHC